MSEIPGAEDTERTTLMPRQRLAWIHAVANNQSVRSVLTKGRFPLVVAAWAVLLTQVKPEWFVPGLIVSLVGALGQLWCFGCLQKRKVLAVRGPYCVSRNPMYLARYLLVLGTVIFSGNPWLVLVFTVAYFFYMVNRVKREEKKLKTIFASAYKDYCASVPRFFPSFRNVTWSRFWFFQWKTFLGNNGHINAFGVLVFYGVSWYFTFPYHAA